MGIFQAFVEGVEAEDPEKHVRWAHIDTAVSRCCFLSEPLLRNFLKGTMDVGSYRMF